MVEKSRAGSSNPIQNVQVARDIQVIAMKTSSFNLLTVSAAFFALCASGMAAGPKSIIQTACLKCHGGASVSGDLDFTQVLTREQKLDAIAKAARGEMPMNGPKLTPAQFAQLKKELGFKTAVASSASGEALPAPPQAHRSLVKSSDGVATAGERTVPAYSSSSKPIFGARVASVAADKIPRAAVARPKPVVKSQAVAADTPKSEDFENVLDAVSSVKDDSSTTSDSIKGLKRDLMPVSRQGDGEPWTVVLQMDDNSWERLTIPDADGESSTVSRQEEVEDN
jgi:hypothetical protein